MGNACTCSTTHSTFRKDAQIAGWRFAKTRSHGCAACCGAYENYGGICKFAILAGTKTDSSAFNGKVIGEFDANKDELMNLCSYVTCILALQVRIWKYYASHAMGFWFHNAVDNCRLEVSFNFRRWTHVLGLYTPFPHVLPCEFVLHRPPSLVSQVFVSPYVIDPGEDLGVLGLPTPLVRDLAYHQARLRQDKRDSHFSPNHLVP